MGDNGSMWLLIDVAANTAMLQSIVFQPREHLFWASLDTISFRCAALSHSSSCLRRDKARHSAKSSKARWTEKGRVERKIRPAVVANNTSKNWLSAHTPLISLSPKFTTLPLSLHLPPWYVKTKRIHYFIFKL